MRAMVSETLRRIGEEVELTGWVHARRDHGKIIFLDLRDRTGVAQLVLTPHGTAGYERGEKARPEWVVGVKGVVAARPDSMANPSLETGSVEVQVSEFTVISEAKTPPFALDDDGREVGEDTRMAYRYLDLRRVRMRDNLRARHRITKFMRDFLTERGFTEVETPILGKSTPEGARDYLVPARVYPGKFYALPQSPQQYKQLLMVAGLERYFQIARCFRDEDTRGDRQPEFTQLDIEMSFVDEDDVMALVEELYLSLVRALYPGKKLRLAPDGRMPRMSYAEAMEKYASDKPDVRENPNDPDELAFLFVTDFPMFEWSETEKRWDAVHHPFTQPKVADVAEFKARFAEDPAGIRAKQYDFVLNGCEIGGGSIRIQDAALLSAVFEAMGNSTSTITARFGHMLEAFEYGVPPHGGVAPGIDRFVMLIQNEPNIREVIAFPKTGDGRDLMMGAPDEVDDQKLKELRIAVRK
ncbi:MAG: aspartate--tRNA ligase [Candidatus Colwellbacteria bacterium]|nr:aspartate--tRNA ligase [Candidatus Colwellbacteria bacterium]